MRAVVGGHREAVDFLLARGADVNEADALTGRTALHVAARKGDLAMVQTLLAAAADVYAQETTSLKSPLHYAVEGRHRKVHSVCACERLPIW